MEMAVERWDSVKWGSWRTDKFKISRKKYRWKTEQIIRFSFHHYLFPPLKNIHFVQMVPITNGKHVMLQVSQYKSVVVKPTKIPHFFIPHCPGIVCFLRQLCWKDCRESLQTNSYLQNPKDNLSFYKKCVFANYSRWTGGVLYVYVP